MAAPSPRCLVVSALRRRFLVASSCALLMALTGCSRIKQQMAETVNNDPQIRAKAVDSERTSCVTTAESKAPKDPAIQSRIQSYCDCFATKGMSSFSNSELMSIGFNGGKFTPQQQAKLMQGVELCRSKLLPQIGDGAPPTAPAPGSQR